MRIPVAVLVIVALLASVCCALDSSAISPLTKLNRNRNHYTLIIPGVDVTYSWGSKTIETELATSYDLVLVHIGGLDEDNTFSLHEWVQSARLSAGADTVSAVGFRDFQIRPAATSRFSNRTMHYVADASVSIRGYLMFPKVIDAGAESPVVMSVSGTHTGAEWDLPKIVTVAEALGE